MQRIKWCRHFMQIVVGLMISVTTAAASSQEGLALRGQWQQGGIVFGKVAPGFAVQVSDRRVRTTETGDFVFGIAADAPPEFTLELIHPQGQRDRGRRHPQRHPVLQPTLAGRPAPPLHPGGVGHGPAGRALRHRQPDRPRHRGGDPRGRHAGAGGRSRDPDRQPGPQVVSGL